jgi:hypothetical protein
MGENKTFNLKGVTSPRLLLDTLLLISISSFVFVATQSQLSGLKPEAVWQNSPFSAEIYRNLCLYVNNFLGRHPRTRMKMCIQLYGYVSYTMYHFILVRGWRSRKLFIKRHIFLQDSAKKGYFCHSTSGLKSYSYAQAVSNKKLDMDINSMLSCKKLEQSFVF